MPKPKHTPEPETFNLTITEEQYELISNALDLPKEWTIEDFYADMEKRLKKTLRAAAPISDNPKLCGVNVRLLRALHTGDILIPLGDFCDIYGFSVGRRSQIAAEFRRLDEDKIIGFHRFSPTPFRPFDNNRQQYSVNLSRLVDLLADTGARVPSFLHKKSDVTERLVEDVTPYLAPRKRQ